MVIDFDPVDDRPDIGLAERGISGPDVFAHGAAKQSMVFSQAGLCRISHANTDEKPVDFLLEVIAALRQGIRRR